jgi:hypothetical protein
MNAMRDLFEVTFTDNKGEMSSLNSALSHLLAEKQ